MIGYGNSMFLATHGILARSASGGGVDPDAQAFITAAAITDPTQQAAINTLVVDLKGYSIWTKFQAIYPVVGGSASAHAVNLKTPGTYNLSFATGVTHSANGMLGNGSTGYANSNFNPNLNGATLNSHHVSFYSRTNSNGTEVEFGAAAAGNQTLLEIRTSGTTYAAINSAPTYINFADTDSRGFYVANRTASNVLNVFRNSTKRVTGATASSGRANANYFILAWNNVTPQYYSLKQCAFASIGDGLTDTDAANFYTAVQAYQTSLGRSIGTQTVSDADAQAFINAAGIDDQVQATAINNLVIGLKADGLWNKMKAIYPVVGGIASSHAVNLKTPGTYNLTFGTGWTHDANGMTSLNTFAQTNLQPSTVLGLNDSHLSYFTTGFGADASAVCMIGAFNSPNRLAIYAAGFYGVNSATFSSYTFSGIGAKFRVISRLSSTVHKFANNGTIQTATLNSSARPTANIELARLGGGTDNFNGICKFASIGDGLTDTDIANFNTAVTTYQTALSRYN